MESHGGKIWVINSNNHGNSGAIFYFKLPIVRANNNNNNSES